MASSYSAAENSLKYSDIGLWRYSSANYLHPTQWNWSLNCSFDWNQVWSIAWSWINWNVCLTIEIQWLSSFIVDWNILLSVDINHMSWVVWSSNYWFSRFRFGNDISFESWLESFWNNRNWNVSSVSSGESINWSFFQW